jgi:hypothetical protein
MACGSLLRGSALEPTSSPAGAMPAGFIPPEGTMKRLPILLTLLASLACALLALAGPAAAWCPAGTHQIGNWCYITPNGGGNPCCVSQGPGCQIVPGCVPPIQEAQPNPPGIGTGPGGPLDQEGLAKAAPADRFCFDGAAVEVGGRKYSLPDLEVLLGEGLKVASVLQQKTGPGGPMHQEQPCDPTLWPYSCSGTGCYGVAVTGSVWIEVRPSTVYPGICVYRRCMLLMQYEDGEGTCHDCSDWAYTTC